MPQTQHVADLMHGYPIQFGFAQLHCGIEHNPALELGTVGKLGPGNHTSGCRLKKFAFSIDNLNGAILSAVFVPVQFKDLGPKVHGPFELLGQNRIRGRDPDSEI